MPITERQRAARRQNLARANTIRLTAVRAALEARLAEDKKRCSWCRRILPLSEFWRDASHADGRRYECAQCTTAYRAELARPGTPLAGYVLRCCGGILVSDPQLGWWRAIHKRRTCRSRWQPDRCGVDGEWERYQGRAAPPVRQRKRRAR